MTPLPPLRWCRFVIGTLNGHGLQPRTALAGRARQSQIRASGGEIHTSSGGIRANGRGIRANGGARITNPCQRWAVEGSMPAVGGKTNNYGNSIL